MKGGEEIENIKEKIPSAVAQNKNPPLISPRMVGLLHNHGLHLYLKDGCWLRRVANNSGRTHTSRERRDASSLQSLRQRLLCVIAPSPTRFTPYILSSSHLPHLHLPLCRPHSASPPHSLHPTIFSPPLRTPFQSSSLPPSNWKVQLAT